MEITKGLLAQLVQSTCLTSRGSQVRILQGPQKSELAITRFFCFRQFAVQKRKFELQIKQKLICQSCLHIR